MGDEFIIDTDVKGIKFVADKDTGFPGVPDDARHVWICLFETLLPGICDTW